MNNMLAEIESLINDKKIIDMAIEEKEKDIRFLRESKDSLNSIAKLKIDIITKADITTEHTIAVNCIGLGALINVAERELYILKRDAESTIDQILNKTGRNNYE